MLPKTWNCTMSGHIMFDHRVPEHATRERTMDLQLVTLANVGHGTHLKVGWAQGGWGPVVPHVVPDSAGGLAAWLRKPAQQT